MIEPKMIREITIDGKIWTADHWFQLGLPGCLHDCLDGTPWVYQESREYLSRSALSDVSEAIEKVFRFPKIEDALEPLKLAYSDYRKRDNEGLSVKPNGLLKNCNFLEVLLWNLNEALTPSLVSNMTQKQIDKNLEDVTRAVQVIKNCPLVDNQHPNLIENLVTSAITKNSPHSHDRFGSVDEAVGAAYEYEADSFEALLTGHGMVRELREYLEETEMTFSFGDLLDQWVDFLQSTQDSGISRPGRGDVEKRHFCASLLDEFGWLSDKNHFREIGILATAIFSDTSEDYVRKVHKRLQT